MKKDIILAGVGGQGILSIATVIGEAAVAQGLFLKQAEVHGMSQRGGDVQSHLRLSDQPIASDLIPEGKAHLIIAVEPMEALRYLPWLAPEGWVITSTQPFINVPNYPDPEEIMTCIKQLNQYVAIDADKMAKEIGNARVTNMIVLGAASPYLDIPFDKLEQAIRTIFNRKGEDIVKLNIQALNSGRTFAEQRS
ncbi:indolepyruvate oxidoreductase [Bacteroidia bacterium]|nr:indolepyruvate oxidoreductase [Bacteroidia bacterium]